MLGRALAIRATAHRPPSGARLDHPHTLTAAATSPLAWRGGDPVGAAQAFEQLLTDRLRILGPDHPDTLATRHDVAHCVARPVTPWRGQAFEQLLTDPHWVLAPDHPETLAARHNLAHWRGEAGDPAAAAQAFEQLLTDRIRSSVPTTPRPSLPS